MNDLISRQVLDLWNRYKPTIAVDAIEYDRELKKLLGTNLASLGTDCISRRAAIDVLENDKAALDKIIKGMSAEDMLLKYYVAQHNQVSCDIDAIVQLPPILPDKDKVSDMLYHIYSIQSPHLDVTGVVAKKYYCEELWKELFGKESELPKWMN